MGDLQLSSSALACVAHNLVSSRAAGALTASADVPGVDAAARDSGDGDGDGAASVQSLRDALALYYTHASPMAASDLEGELMLFTVTFCANPANDLTCPPSYILY